MSIVTDYLPEADVKAPHGSYAKWLHYASCCIASRTDQLEFWADVCKKVARVCADASERGEITSIYHGLSIVNNSLGSCPCGRCTKERFPTMLPTISQYWHKKERLEYLRGELRAERISTEDLIELQSLAKYIDDGDVEPLEAAGVPEFPEESEALS